MGSGVKEKVGLVYVLFVHFTVQNTKQIFRYLSREKKDEKLGIFGRKKKENLSQKNLFISYYEQDSPL